MKKIVCFGDSNTWGHNPMDKTRFDDNTRWTKRLAQKLEGQYEIIEAGLNGRCAAFIDEVKPYRHGLSSLRMILEMHQPMDYFLIMLGTNDLKANFCGNAVAISNGIREMVQIIQNQTLYVTPYKAPKIIIVAPIHLCEEGFHNKRTREQFNEQSIAVGKKLAEFYKEIADTYDCMFLDASQYAQASAVDGIHMDAENHQRLSEALYPLFLK